MAKYFSILFFLIFFFANCSNKTVKDSSNWQDIANRFTREYPTLNIARLQLSFVGNLESIHDKDSIQLQEQFFQRLKNDLEKISPKSLSESERLDFEIIEYELALNLERIKLEKQFVKENIKPIPTSGLSAVANGKKWYAYFLKRWIDKDVTPDEMFEFGLKEIEKVKSKMKDVQIKSGLDSLAFQKHINESSFFYNDVSIIQKKFEEIKLMVASKLPKYFPHLDLISDVKIARGTYESLAHVPAYYSNQTFYYNYFDKPFNKRQMVWFYLHEAMPGHHYQIRLSEAMPLSDIKNMFSYSCYREGWAAYIEEIGNEIGAYQNIYDELGKWEWDIIRSVRVAMDVGLNYYQWSDEKALAFWQQHIHGQDEIGLREIARMKKWPVQVITYKYGADKILKWKAKFEKEKDFDLKEFHKKILEYGSLPFSILEKRIGI